MNPIIGGPCQGIRHSIGALSKLGITNEVVSLDNPNDDFLGLDPFPIYALGPDKRPWAYSAKLLPWLLENLSRFDVVIMHGLWLYPSYAVWKAIIQQKQQPNTTLTRFYIMPHGMLDPWFQKAEGRKLKALRNWLYWKVIENKVVNESDGLLFTCQTELLLARKPFRPYHPKQEINVGYGIEEPPAYTKEVRKAFLEKYSEIIEQPYLLFLSRIHYKKGVDLLVKAYWGILKERNEAKLVTPKLIIAGPGLETPYGQTILQFVNEHPQLKSMILFTGMLTGDAKWGAIYGCEAFILPSHQENFGIAVAEALSCGKPVLISDQVNIWREIEAGESGLIAPISLDGTAQLIQKWLALTPVEQQLKGKNAKVTFKRHFAIQPAAENLKNAISTSIM
ncbi:hypothetical protein GCM10028808_45840 [Spirosoma migulaei]